MHFVYIIHSTSHDRYYVGESVNPLVRLKQHTEGHFINSSTRFATDWNLARQIQLQSRMEAIQIERYIKSMKSAKFIKKLCTDEVFFNSFKTIVLEKFKIEVS